MPRDLGREHAREKIAAGARRERRDQSHWFVRIALCMGSGPGAHSCKRAREPGMQQKDRQLHGLVAVAIGRAPALRLKRHCRPFTPWR